MQTLTPACMHESRRSSPDQTTICMQRHRMNAHNPLPISCHSTTIPLQPYVDVDAWNSPLSSTQETPEPFHSQPSPFRTQGHPALRLLECRTRQCECSIVQSADIDRRLVKGVVGKRSRVDNACRWGRLGSRLEPVVAEIKEALV